MGTIPPSTIRLYWPSSSDGSSGTDSPHARSDSRGPPPPWPSLGIGKNGTKIPQRISKQRGRQVYSRSLTDEDQI
jgi:hypothetical protein